MTREKEILRMMKVIERTVNFVGYRISRAANLAKDREEIIIYGLYSAVIVFGTIAGIILLSCILGVFWYGVIAASSAAILRHFSGGAHFSRPEACMTISSLIYPVLGYAATKFDSDFAKVFIPGALLLCIICVFLYSPAEVPEKPLSSGLRRRLRIYSCLCIAAFIGIACFNRDSGFLVPMVLGLVWQGLSLTPAGFYFYRRTDSSIDTFLMKLRRRSQ
jgi:accessory gene regulator B